MDKEAIKKARGERLILSLSARQKCPCAECRIRCQQCQKKGRPPLRLPPKGLTPSRFDGWCDSCFVNTPTNEKYERVTPAELQQLREKQRLAREERLRIIEQREAEKAARKAQRKTQSKTRQTNSVDPEQETARDKETKRQWEEQRQRLESIFLYDAED